MPNLISNSDMSEFWGYLHWGLLQAAPFLMMVVASYAVYLVIRIVKNAIWPDAREDDDIDQDMED
ncbi:hypothetical protein SAMN04489725_11610 [Alicyclobacillus hesperidum]|uniref:Uncharacterized protein n=1 Tax=Alicyclobacillus hesperidum TaxID=89784 RepID=A0A1H2WQ29_9BACL|nr:hypothetical protein SAMN04489725_11610 [Alicyclobacillus hesperidum]